MKNVTRRSVPAVALFYRPPHRRSVLTNSVSCSAGRLQLRPVRGASWRGVAAADPGGRLQHANLTAAAAPGSTATAAATTTAATTTAAATATTAAAA